MMMMMAYARGSARKGYLFQASGIWKGRDFISWSIWKGRGISVSLQVKRPKMDNTCILRLRKSRENVLVLWFIHTLKTVSIKIDKKVLYLGVNTFTPRAPVGTQVHRVDVRTLRPLTSIGKYTFDCTDSKNIDDTLWRGYATPSFSIAGTSFCASIELKK